MKPDSPSSLFEKMKRPLIAILRGIKPNESEAIVSALIEEGFEAIEIPLNSPDPFVSIEAMARMAPDHVLIGAGTVLTVAQVDQLHNAGGKLLVSPNVDTQVLDRAAEYAMVTMPGVFTPTEALLAIKHGACGLKFFPASVLGPAGIKAISAILPPGTILGAVGGVSEKNFAAYKAAGIKTFGMGSSLYKPGDSADMVRENARTVISQYDQIFAG